MSEIRVISGGYGVRREITVQSEEMSVYHRDENHFRYYRDVLKFPEQVGLPRGTDFMLVVLGDEYLPDTVTRKEFPEQRDPPYGRQRADVAFDPPRPVCHEVIESYVEGLDAERHRAFVVSYKQSWFCSNGEDDWDEPARIVIQIFGVDTGCLAELTRLVSDKLSDPSADEHIDSEHSEWKQEQYDERRLSERQWWMEKRLNKIGKLSKKLAKLTPFERALAGIERYQS